MHTLCVYLAQKMNDLQQFFSGPAHTALLLGRIVILEAWHVRDVHFAQITEGRSIRHICILAPAQSSDSSDSFYPPTKRSKRFKHSPSHCNQGLHQVQTKTMRFTLRPSHPASAYTAPLITRALFVLAPAYDDSTQTRNVSGLRRRTTHVGVMQVAVDMDR